MNRFIQRSNNGKIKNRSDNCKYSRQRPYNTYPFHAYASVVCVAVSCALVVDFVAVIFPL